MTYLNPTPANYKIGGCPQPSPHTFGHSLLHCRYFVVERLRRSGRDNKIRNQFPTIPSKCARSPSLTWRRKSHQLTHRHARVRVIVSILPSRSLPLGVIPCNPHSPYKDAPVRPSVESQPQHPSCQGLSPAKETQRKQQLAPAWNFLAPARMLLKRREYSSQHLSQLLLWGVG